MNQTPDPSTRDTAADRVLNMLRSVDDETLARVVEHADTDGTRWKNDVEVARSYAAAFAAVLAPALRAVLDAQPVNEERIEVAAIAILGALRNIAFAARPGETWQNDAWDTISESAREEYRACARAALSSQKGDHK